MKKYINILFRAWWPAVLLVLVSYFFDWLGYYQIWPSLDIPMHIIGGILVAHAIYTILEVLPASYAPQKLLPKCIFVVAMVGMVTIAWETYEFFQDLIFGTVSQLGIADALLDMWLGIFGSIVYNGIWICRCFLTLKPKGSLNLTNCTNLTDLPDDLVVGGDIYLAGTTDAVKAKARKLKAEGKITGEIFE